MSPFYFKAIARDLFLAFAANCKRLPEICIERRQRIAKHRMKALKQDRRRLLPCNTEMLCVKAAQIELLIPVTDARRAVLAAENSIDCDLTSSPP